MDLKALIESLATGWGERLTILVPLALVAAVGLYVLWLLLGYLRASNVGIEAEAVGGEVIVPDPATPAVLPGRCALLPGGRARAPARGRVLRPLRGGLGPGLRDLRYPHRGHGRDVLQLRGAPVALRRKSRPAAQFPISDWT